MEAAHGMTLSGAAFLVKAKQLTADQSLQESLMEDGFEDNTNPEAGSLSLEAVRLLNLSEFPKYLPTCGVGTAGCAQDQHARDASVSGLHHQRRHLHATNASAVVASDRLALAILS